MEVSDASPADVLEHFNAKEIVSHFGFAALLDEIGSNEAKIHFGLTEIED